MSGLSKHFIIIVTVEAVKEMEFMNGIQIYNLGQVAFVFRNLATPSESVGWRPRRKVALVFEASEDSPLQLAIHPKVSSQAKKSFQEVVAGPQHFTRPSLMVLSEELASYFKSSGTSTTV